MNFFYKIERQNKLLCKQFEQIVISTYTLTDSNTLSNSIRRVNPLIIKLNYIYSKIYSG